jgi:hypothetical protein
MACFASTDAARSAYQAVQDFIFRYEGMELSVYNLIVAQVPHVVVLGEQSGAAINEQLTGLLADGVATHLPPGLIAQLAERGSWQDGPWSERHPGLPGDPHI